MTTCVIKHQLFLILACAVFLTGFSEARAQMANGAIRGQIQDAEFFVPLQGVTVTLEGPQSVTVMTDANGSYFANNLPPGQYNLIASGDGFVRERLPNVVVSAGSVKEADIGLTSVVVELDEFVVSAEELVDTASESAPLALRTELKSFTDVLGAKFISQTGASDAAKLLAKQTGVNVSDGKFVVVRGLADRYNSVTLNGLRVPSSDPDRRAVALDLFPSSVIRDIRTSKTFLPYFPGEATGANIDVKTKSVPEQDFVRAKVGTGYNSQATGNDGFLSYNGGGTGMLGNAGDRGLPGFIRNSTAAELPSTPTNNASIIARRQLINETLSQEMGTKEKQAPMDFTLEASLGHRTEFMGAPAGITVAIDYSKKYNFSDKDALGRYEFVNTGPNRGLVQSVSRMVLPPSEIGNFIRSGIQPNASFPTSGNLPYGMRVGQETMRAGLLVSAGIQPSENDEVTLTYFFNRVAEDRATLQFGFRPEDPDSSPYREFISYTERQLRTWQLAGSHLVDSGSADLKVDWGFSYNQSSQLEPDQRLISMNYDLGTGGYTFPGGQTVEFAQRVWRELYDENYSAKLDLETDLFGDSLPDDMKAKLRFGGLLDYSDRTFRSDSFAYTILGPSASFSSPLTPFTRNPLTIGDVLLVNQLSLITNPNQAPYLYRLNDPEVYQASQMISSGYLMLDVDLMPGLNIALGARVETTDLKVNASPIWIYDDEELRKQFLTSEQQTDQAILDLLRDAASPTDSAARRAARADERLLARSRASISSVDVLPALSVTWDLKENQRVRGAVSQTIARPSFKEMAPVAFLNPESGDFFIGNVDLKLSSIVNYDVRWEWFPEPGGLIGVSGFAKTIENPIEFSQQGDYTRYINVDSATVYGFELEFQRDFSFITAGLKPFSLGANYSYIKSLASRTGEGNFVFGRERRLQGQPDYIFNFNLTYDDPENPLSGGVFLNITGPQLFAVSTRTSDPDVFQEPFTTLDLGLSYRFTKSCKLTFRAANLANSQLKRYYNNSQKPVYSIRSPGIGYSLSMQFDW